MSGIFLFLSVAHHGLHAQAVVEYALAQAQILGCDLKKLVVGEELKALLKTHLSGRDKAQRLVGAGSTGVSQMLGAADIDRHIVALRAHADYHAGIDLRAGAYKHRTTLLSVPDAVGNCPLRSRMQ